MRKTFLLSQATGPVRTGKEEPLTEHIRTCLRPWALRFA